MRKGVSAKLKGEIRVCNHCGIPYEPLALNQKYCSPACGYTFRGERKGKIDKTCPACFTAFKAYGPRHTFCSRECQLQAYVEWFNIREFVLERDNYTCVDCGSFLMKAGLEAHHVKPLFKGGLNDEANIITLCHKCHKNRHSKSG